MLRLLQYLYSKVTGTGTDLEDVVCRTQVCLIVVQEHNRTMVSLLHTVSTILGEV